MAGIKKGVIYSIGLFLLSGLVLSLAIISFRNFNLSQERFSEIIIFDNVYELDKSITDGFKEIFDLQSGITITNGENVIFNEALPNKAKDMFVKYIGDYEKFLESNFSVLIDTSIMKEDLMLNITPNGVEYYHEKFGDNIIKVKTSNADFDGYTIIISTGENLDSTSCVGSGGNEGVYLNLYASGITGSCEEKGSDKSKIDLFNTNEVIIATVAVINKDLTISSFKQINVSTSVDSLENLGQKNIILAIDFIYINYSQFGITKNSTVILS